MALDEHHERVLVELEQQVAAHDPAFARRFRMLSQAGLRPEPTMSALLASLLLLAGHSARAWAWVSWDVWLVIIVVGSGRRRAGAGCSLVAVAVRG